MERETKLLTWLEKEKNKDIQDLNREKQEIINQIKKLKKEDILPSKPKKQSVWKKILKFLTT